MHKFKITYDNPIASNTLPVLEVGQSSGPSQHIFQVPSILSNVGVVCNQPYVS